MKKTIFSFVVVLGIAVSACNSTEEKILAKAKKIHEKALTVDSHVDTPMWLTREGFDYGEDHSSDNRRLKLDLPRMKEGGLDGVFFAVFLGQGMRNDAAHRTAKMDADRIIDSISATIDRYSDEMELAVDANGFEGIVAEGKKAIFLGMENGYPIGNDVDLVDSFYNKGVRYITLCHSYNNDICDSSTDTAEYMGLSIFGHQVVDRMNELGVMIDMSHASDSTFYQVIRQSKDPIIASHSCARALCDHPRNLTDDMLLKLKENDGVIQMCILSAYVKSPEPQPLRDSAKQEVYAKHGNYYELDEEGKEGFLVDWYQVDKDFPQKLATVADVVDHIDHIVEVAGIDHVGIGTDFDGGGGVEGCYDVSEMENITVELVRRGYSKMDINKIWSANIMRVLTAVAK